MRPRVEMHITSFLSIDLPERGWRTIEVPNGLVLVRPLDYAACGERLEHASFTLAICRLDDANVDALMKLRVTQGSPEVSATTVAGVPATQYAYTDGVRLIRSYFVERATGVIEITLATYLDASGAQKVELESTASEIFGHVEWR